MNINTYNNPTFKNPTYSQIFSLIKISWIDQILQSTTSFDKEKVLVDALTLADLREVVDEKKIIPPVYSDKKKSKLSSPLFVQITSIRDIAIPEHKEIKNEDEEQEEKFESKFLQSDILGKAKPQSYSTRMLRFGLTDGLSSYQAIEYEKIEALSIDLPINLKMMIFPGTEYRKGVLFLTKKCFALFGNPVFIQTCIKQPKINEKAREKESKALASQSPFDRINTNSSSGTFQEQSSFFQARNSKHIASIVTEQAYNKILYEEGKKQPVSNNYTQFKNNTSTLPQYTPQSYTNKNSALQNIVLDLSEGDLDDLFADTEENNENEGNLYFDEDELKDLLSDTEEKKDDYDEHELMSALL